jgi:type II secretory pathway pseudopilin PulG
MKKIIVDKGEGIAEVIDRILNEPDSEISLVVPKGSSLGKSISNFHLLKREADSAGRDIIVESVDETILAFAKESGLESSHPLWKGVRGTGGFSDIVSRPSRATTIEDSELESSDDDQDEEPKEKPIKKVVKSRHEVPVVANKRHKKAESLMDDDDNAEEEEAMIAKESEEEDERMESDEKRFFGPRSSYDDDDDSSSENRGIGKKVGIGIAIVVVLLLIGIYTVSAFFNRADIIINFQQQAWSYQNNFTAETSATGSALTGNVIGATVFTTNKNDTETFPASAVSSVSIRAQGQITIYNDYSAASQELVATTRFLTPDGKIFRLVNTVTVPGEQTVGGKLTPSSITAPIVADQAGLAYNVGPVAKLTIPGFDSNAALEAGFYGAITSSTNGGFVGQKATPTAADITAAKASTTALLQSAVQGSFSGSYPGNFKILDGATNVQVGKLSVNTTTDANGNFTVFGQATLQAIGFDETALKTYLLSLAQAQESNSVFKTLNLTYSSVTANFTTGQVSFALSAQGSLEPALSVNDFSNTIAGESISTARTAIAALPNLASGQISVWPSWLWDIPSNTSKIHVTVN